MAEGIENVNIVIEYGSPRSIITKEISTTIEADLIICGATGGECCGAFLNWFRI
ncbi:nucleotide-binding universal stress UspA family protein [Virgibacillus natechei]|uniref:Nucleotide-binding universal stress UspA family protein n=1 Tax=Virgibacillus natechei TaxID=1216297 RepID=A0ABS4IBR9_9BACI|nr:nucleotide-binding universal stress UspA family protein [Virgibacillus natechei]